MVMTRLLSKTPAFSAPPPCGKNGGGRPQTEGKKEKRKRKEKEVPGFHLVDSMEADDVSVLFD
jgi:hypothetical protein